MIRDRKEHPSTSLAADWAAKLEKAETFDNAIFSERNPDGPIPLIPQPEPGRLPGKPPFGRLPPEKPGRPFDEPLGPIDPREPSPPPPIVSLEFCVPLNPAVRQLKQQIGTQLYKL